MKIGYRGSLQREMIIYFLLIGFASFLIAGEFIFDIHGKELRTELTRNFERLHRGEIQPDAAFQPIQTLRNKAALMVALFLIVVLILLTMFVKNITEPMQHMIEVSKLIAAGDLSHTVSIHAKNELAELGDTVNDLTSNLQEILLLSKDLCAFVDQCTGGPATGSDLHHSRRETEEGFREKVRVLNSKAKFLNDIIHHCKFYGMAR